MNISGLGASQQPVWRASEEQERLQRAAYSKAMTELQQQQFQIRAARAARAAQEKDTLAGAFVNLAPAETIAPTLSLGNRLDILL